MPFPATVTVEEMSTRLRGMSATRRRVLLERFGVALDRAATLTVPQRFLLIASLQCHRLARDPEGAAAIADHYWVDLAAAGDAIAAAPADRVPAVRLAVLDGRYTTASGTAGFFDVLAGTRVPRLPVAPVETLTVDLTAAFFRAEGVPNG